MSHLDADDRQVLVHSYRQQAEMIGMFRHELLTAGIPRWLSYRRIGREEITDCVPLCRKHHDMAHALVENDGVPLRRAHIVVARTEGTQPRKKVVVLPAAGKEVMRRGKNWTPPKKKKRRVPPAKLVQPFTSDKKQYEEVNRMSLRPVPSTQPTSEQIIEARMKERQQRAARKKGLMKRG